VLKPLQGRGRISAEATVTRPVLTSPKGVVLSCALNPSFSELNPYNMAACAIDGAVRAAVAAGLTWIIWPAGQFLLVQPRRPKAPMAIKRSGARLL